MERTFSITNRTRARRPAVSFERLKSRILGHDYHLSLALIGDAKSRELNRTYRKKNYVPNVLAFPLSAREGEVFLNPRKAAHEAARLNMSRRTYVAYLFIHACLHLKGMRHGVTMERIERRLLRQLELP